MDSLFRVEDQVTLVTGGSRGIGKAIAAGFADRGAQVVIASRQQDVLEGAAREMAGGKHEVLPLVCDVSDGDQIRGLVEGVLEKFGRIDTLVNVAGVNRRKATVDFTPDDYDFILDINLKGPFLLSQLVGAHMIERKQGSQINVASLNTFRPLKGVLPYAMSKAGLGAMTQGLAIEWGQHNVRVNALAPGFILTDLTQKLWSDPKMQAWNAQNCPLKRLGQPEDMVGTAIFLASPAAAFLTGQVIYVDGGVTAGLHWPIEL